MRKMWLGLSAAALGVAALGIYATVPAGAAAEDSQTFSPSRYALVEGEVNVGILQNPGAAGNVQKALFRVDTVSGQVWVLQLSVVAFNDPTVTSAVWAPVSNSGTYQPVGNVNPNENNFQGGF